MIDFEDMMRGLKVVEKEDYSLPRHNYVHIHIGRYEELYFYSTSFMLPLSGNGNPYNNHQPCKTIEEGLLKGREAALSDLRRNIDWANETVKSGSDYYLPDVRVGSEFIDLLNQKKQLSLF